MMLLYHHNNDTNWWSYNEASEEELLLMRDYFDTHDIENPGFDFESRDGLFPDVSEFTRDDADTLVHYLARYTARLPESQLIKFHGDIGKVIDRIRERRAETLARITE